METKDIRVETQTIRIRSEDYKRSRKSFLAYKGETAQSWFFRLTEHLSALGDKK